MSSPLSIINCINGDYIMTKEEIQKLVNEYTSNGGSVKILTPSRKRFKTWRGKAGAYNRGAKKINLQDNSFQK